MKRMIMTIWCFVMLLVLSACTVKPENGAAEQQTVAPQTGTRADGTEQTEGQSTAPQTGTAANGTERAEQTEGQSTASQTGAAKTEQSDLAEEQQGEYEMIYADTGKQILEIVLEDNSSAEAFLSLLKEGDVTVSMHDYGSFEKVGALGSELPANDERITTEPGDVILYQGDQITIYYDANTWTFTRLGKVRGLSQDELKEALGDGDLTVVFSLNRGLPEKAGIGGFDFENKTVLLNSGYEMPIMGLGTYSLDYDTCVNSVKTLLQNGGRLIDTAYMYHNEEAVGDGVRQAMEEYGIPREDIFVITKIYPSQFDDPESAIEAALEKLDIEYIDMMLLHHPGTDDLKAYLAMEKYVEQGKIRSLGLSNWYVEELTEFLPQVNITPALVQNEIHPYYQEQDVVPFIQEKGIAVQCWYPLGGRGHTADLLGNEVIAAIAEAHGVSSAQVILRWDLQRGIIVIPGSGNPKHIRENMDLFSFELTEAEMEQINALDRGEKHDWY